MRERKVRNNNTTEGPDVFQVGEKKTNETKKQHFSAFAISFQNVICSYVSETRKSSIYSMKKAGLPLHLHWI